MRKIICCLCFPFRFIIIIVFSTILTLVYWLLCIPLALPFHLFRYILSLIVRSLDPDVCKIVDRFSHIASRDFADWYTKPSQAITTIFKLTNNLTIEDARRLALDKMVNQKLNENDCQLEYPELQQYYTKRLGFLFYKWDRDFQVANHVKLYFHKENTLMRIWESIMTKPFSKKQSAWEMFVIPRYIPRQNTKEQEGVINNTVPSEEQCLLILRIHHGLCDGASIHKLLLSITDNGKTNWSKDIVAFQKAPTCMDSIINLRGFFCGPTAIIKKLSKGLDYYNPLHPPLNKKTGKLHIVKTTIDLEIVKNICRAHLNVSVHSVLIAALTGGIRNFLLENGHSIPLSPIRLGIPFPKPGHSLKLRNEYFISMIDLPVEKKSPRQRLLACEKRLNRVKSESVMPFLVQLFNLVGGLPFKLVRMITLKSSFTIVYSEIKGPFTPLTILDRKYELLELIFSIGLGTDDLGMGFSTISYNGKMHLMVTLDHSVAKTLEKGEQLLQLIEKEFEELQYGDTANL